MLKKHVTTLTDLYFFNLMYLFLIIVELINVYFSFATGVGSFYKFILPLIYLILGLIFKFKYDSDEKYAKVFSTINLTILIGYLLLYIFFGVEVFFAGLYLIEVAIVLNFSNFKLRNKILILFTFGSALLISFLFFNLLSVIVERNFLFIIGLFIVILIELALSEKIIKVYRELIDQSSQHSKQISNTNRFYSTILDQENIRIIYYYPDDQSAILVSNNFESKIDRKISNLQEFIRDNKVIPLEYIGAVQNYIEVVKKEGFSSIVIPVNLSDSKIWMKLNGAKMLDEDSKRVKIIISITNINDLKTIELKFKNALKQCSISIWEYDIAKDLVYNYSDSILDYYFYGKSIENAKNTLVNRNIIYYDDIDIFNRGLEQVQNGESHVSFEIRIFPLRSSSYTWVRLNFTCFKDSHDNPTTAWVTIENIDDAKSSEKWLEIERKKNFDNRNGLVAMAEINVSRNFVISYNSKFREEMCTLKDHSIKALVDSFTNIGIEIEGKDKLMERLSQEFMLDKYGKGQRILEYEYKVITKSNDILYIANVIKLFLNLKTKEVIAFIFIYDVTQSAVMKLSIDSILRSKFVYLAYVNILNSHMTISRTQLIDVTNAKNPFRIYKDEWEVFIEKYVHPDDKAYVYKNVAIENVRNKIKDRTTFSFDYRISDGGNMMTWRRCHFVKTDQKSPYIIILEENVSAEMISRIKHELDLKDALKKATEAASAKSEFLSRMSHEIRTPLSAIIGLSELGNSAKLEETVDYFNKINDSGQYLLGLMNDILDMNKLELGQVKLNPDYVDIDDFYNIILTIIKSQARKKNITFEFSKEGPYYKYQYLEKLRLQQILLNVLNNAIKYTHNGGKVSYTIKNIEKSGKPFAVHIVEDTGVGISKDFLNQVFNPFSRERNSLSDTEGGTGLGLAICANLVKQLDGEIKVKSKLNEGTKVEITLPITIASKEEYIKETSEDEDFDEEKMFIGKKILIAEDHKINAMIISTILGNRGIETVHVLNGILAVNTFSKSKEGEYDMILMDIMMPELNGLEAAKRIRELNRKDSKSIPIIALSANAFEEDKIRSIQFGMNDHLKKPIETKVLIRTLNKFL